MPRAKAKAKGAAVPPPMSPRHTLLVTVICDQMGLERSDVTLDSTIDDLGMDSLDFIEVIMELEEHLRIDIDEELLSSKRTVGEALAHLESLVAPEPSTPARDGDKT